jgi:hypothetical protein
MQIHYALFIIDPASQPPFTMELGLDGGDVHYVKECLHIPDAISRLENLVNENQAVLLPHFTLLYPIYLEAMETDAESVMMQVAFLIKEQADAKKWGFGRVFGLTGTTPLDFVK